MIRLLQKLHSVSIQVEELREYVELLQRENNDLKEQLQEAEARLKGKSHAYEDMRKKYEVMKVAKGLSNEADKKEIKEKIDSYLAEIDECIKFFGD